MVGYFGMKRIKISIAHVSKGFFFINQYRLMKETGFCDTFHELTMYTVSPFNCLDLMILISVGLDI